MTSHSGQGARDLARRASLRWLVHLGLIATVVVSLVFEPLVLTIHIAVGLVFVVLVGGVKRHWLFRPARVDEVANVRTARSGGCRPCWVAVPEPSAVAFLAVVLLAVTICEFSDSTAERALAAAPPRKGSAVTINLVRSDTLYKGVPYAYASIAPRIADLHRRSMPSR